MDVSLYSSLPYSVAIPYAVSDQVRSVRSIAGDALTAIQGWCSFDMVSRATFVPIDWTADSTFRESRIRRSRYDRLIRSVCENSGRIFIKTIHVCAHDLSSYIFIWQRCTSIYIHLWYDILKLKMAIQIWFVYIFRLSVYFSWMRSSRWSLQRSNGE